MKIVIAPDSFKGSLTAMQAATAMEKGVRAVFPDAELDIIPMADGGEGTLMALVNSTNGKIRKVNAFDPLGRPIIGEYGVLGNGQTAVIEMSTVSGLLLLKDNERNPLYTTTFGTGQLIKNAVNSGYRNLIVAIGGSATNDCGTGMAQALGARFFRKDKSEITETMCGRFLVDVAAIDISNIDNKIKSCCTVVASDVTNPLLGENGCAFMFAKQKGATPEIMLQLEENMTSFIEIAEKTLEKSVRNIPGAGAAGGMGAGLMLFLEAEIKSGIEIVMETCNFSERIKDADLILTGEGKIDNQTAFGKTISGIAMEAKKAKIPVIAFAGKVDNIDTLYSLGVTKCFSISPENLPLEEAINKAEIMLQNTVEEIMRKYSVGNFLKFVSSNSKKY